MSTQQQANNSRQRIPLLNRVIADFERGEHEGDEVKQNALQQAQLQRKRLFPIVESGWQVPGRMIAYVARFGPEGCEVEERDITAFESMLNSIGQVPNLLLMVHSPG
jgi:hypothetical protein